MFPLLAAFAAATGALASPPPQAEQAAVRQVMQRGALLYHLDRAAWVSTDEMLKAVPDPRSLGLAGWIVDREGDHLEAVYYRLDAGRPAVVFTADVKDDVVTSTHLFVDGPAPALTPLQERMVRARTAISGQDVNRCTQGAMNTVVIPPERADGPVDVYLLTSQATSSEIPMGGHYRFTVAPDGSVTARRSFTKSCLNLALTKDASGAPPAALIVTHLLDATPTEIHVFMSLQIAPPIYVVTPIALPAEVSEDSRVWSVHGGVVRYDSMLSEQKSGKKK